MTQVWNVDRKRRELHASQNGACALCGEGISLRGTGRDAATLDHIIPKSKGGGGELGNLQLAHKRCNEARGNEIATVTVEYNGVRVLSAPSIKTVLGYRHRRAMRCLSALLSKPRGEAPLFDRPYDETADTIGSYNDAVRAVGERVKAGGDIPAFFLSDKPEAAE